MEVLISLTVLIFLPCIVLVYADICPYGFVRNKQSCYWFSNEKGTFGEASATCKFLDSDLAAITSVEENNYIRGYVARHAKDRPYFIGGSDMRHEGIWTWEKPTQRFKYSNWRPGEPNSYPHKDATPENCLQINIRSNDLGWNDAPCSHAHFFICETNID